MLAIIGYVGFLSLQEFGFKNMGWDGGFKYNMKNCLYESVLEKIITNCTCKPVFVNFKLQVCMVYLLVFYLFKLVRT